MVGYADGLDDEEVKQVEQDHHHLSPVYDVYHDGDVQELVLLVEHEGPRDLEVVRLHPVELLVLHGAVVQQLDAEQLVEPELEPLVERAAKFQTQRVALLLALPVIFFFKYET